MRLFAFKNGYYDIGTLHFQMGRDIAYKCRDDILLQRVPFYPSRQTYECVFGPMLNERAYREDGQYSVEVDLSNPSIRPFGPFLPYHLRNPQLLQYNALEGDVPF